MIWFTLVIPVVITAYLLLYHRNEVKWWEIIAQFAVCVVVIVSAIAITGWVQTRDVEWWGHLGVKAIHDEPYDYMGVCSRVVSCGKNCTTVQTYPCVQHVSRSCWLKKSDGRDMYISYAKYKELTKRWGGNQTFVDMHRDYYSQDGDRYTIDWPKDPLVSEAIVTEHSYKNKVAASSDVFNFPEVSKEDFGHYGLYDYPPLFAGYEQITILDHGKTHITKPYSRYWRYLNGKLGPIKEVRLWVLIFRNQPLQAAKLQEAYWKGGNKNEFIICIGINDDEEVEWSHVISWTEAQTIKVETRDHVANMGKLDLMALAQWTEKEVLGKFKRPPYEENFSYLEIKPSGTAIVISVIVILIVNLGMAFWVVKNQFYDEPQLPRYQPTGAKTIDRTSSKKKTVRRKKSGRRYRY